MNSILIKNAKLVNEGQVFEGDLGIRQQRICRIDNAIPASYQDRVVDADGCYLLPGMIDDQVHFREPGLTHKGSIASESRAAVAGGITSYMEMPNVKPATTTIKMLEDKYDIAAKHSMVNYAFYLGATESNLEQIKRLKPKDHCGVKVFMGASTGDLLVEHPAALEGIFRDSPVLIVTHCEDSRVIDRNLTQIGADKRTPSISDHPIIRDVEACYASSSYAVALAKNYKSQLHVLHITTEKELSLFAAGAVEDKAITAEVCVHHLWFSDKDYASLGNLIKCNPAIKSEKDRDSLIQALYENKIDIIATDHAPHTLTEKQVSYPQAPAGLPLVEHALLSLFDHVKCRRFTVEQIAEKTAHNPAKRFSVIDRGFIREGYYADLVLVNPDAGTLVTNDEVHYGCGWSPFHGHRFSARIESTWVNGKHVYDGRKIIESGLHSLRLEFAR